jgi:hypothetical protein
MSSACASCGPIDPAEARPVPPGEAAGIVLRDWRTWALAVAAMVVVGLAVGALGATGVRLPAGSVGAGGGAIIGLMVAARIARVRRCGRCGAALR